MIRKIYRNTTIEDLLFVLTENDLTFTVSSDLAVDLVVDGETYGCLKSF